MKQVEVGEQKQCRDAWRKAPHKAGKYMKLDWYLQLWVFMITFLSSSPQLSLFLSDVMILGPVLQREAGMIPKQETIIIPLNLYIRIPKGLNEWTVPSTFLGKLGFTTWCTTPDRLITCITINFNDQMLVRVPGYQGQSTVVAYLTSHSVLCTNTYHPCFCA